MAAAKYLGSMKKMGLLLGILWSWCTLAQWQLSPQAQISVITCGPGQNELYSAFGHSAVRVHDPKTGFDLLYNYGVFDFDQPNFYLNFTKGNLLYKLAVTDYSRFVRSYTSEGRFVHEQILNLSPWQKQAYFNFLQVNALPQNATYRYDYFYDNCATRIRDGLLQVLGDTLHFDSSYVEAKHSIRELCDLYLSQQPWGDLGIDICLGLPMDKKASAFEYMFLPDYLEKGIASATLKTAEGTKPLVAQRQVTFAGKPQDQKSTVTPTLVFLVLLAVVLALSIRQYRKKSYRPLPDFLLFLSVGLVGLLLFILWFFTDHAAAARNLNLLWALPFHLFLAFLLFSDRARKRSRLLFLIGSFWHGAVAVAWFMFPQDLHLALFFLNLILALRTAFIYQLAKLP